MSSYLHCNGDQYTEELGVQTASPIFVTSTLIPRTSICILQNQYHYATISMVQFQLNFSIGSCDTPESAEKGVEFSILGGDGSWVPLAYYHYDYTRRPEIRIGNFSEQSSNSNQRSVRIRGYDVPAYQLNNSLSATLDICDPTYLQQSHAQFRWLETSRHPMTNMPVDVWGLDDVLIVAMNNGSRQVLIEDEFDSQSVLE